MEHYYLTILKSGKLEMTDVPFNEAVKTDNIVIQYNFCNIMISVPNGVITDNDGNTTYLSPFFKQKLDIWGNTRGYFNRSLPLVLANFYEDKLHNKNNIEAFGNKLSYDYFRDEIRENHLVVPEFVSHSTHFRFITIREYFDCDLVSYFANTKITKYEDFLNDETLSKDKANVEFLFNLMFNPKSKYECNSFVYRGAGSLLMSFNEWDMSERVINNRLSKIKSMLNEEKYVDILIKRLKKMI